MMNLQKTTFRPLLIFALTIFLVASPRLWSAEPVPSARPDFKTALDETVKILSVFIKVDTSNPPGNETKGAELCDDALPPGRS